jgi:hypothetical protein
MLNFLNKIACLAAPRDGLRALHGWRKIPQIVPEFMGDWDKIARRRITAAHFLFTFSFPIILAPIVFLKPFARTGLLNEYRVTKGGRQ